MTIPHSVTSIGESSFSECSSLEEITIDSPEISIGYDAFGGCSSLKQIKALCNIDLDDTGIETDC